LLGALMINTKTTLKVIETKDFWTEIHDVLQAETSPKLCSFAA
jgi:hypothetical protein